MKIKITGSGTVTEIIEALTALQSSLIAVTDERTLTFEDQTLFTIITQD